MESAQQWPQGPNKPKIQPNEVHIWKYSITNDTHINDSLTTLRNTLSTEEQQRLNRISNPQAKNEFILSHGNMRLILARYLMLKPAGIELCQQPGGKPQLAPLHQQPLEFNLSHSHGMALVAVSMNRPVGVDIEKIRTTISYEKLANRFFSTQEAEDLLSLPKEQQLLAFIMTWTRKEALMKATGTGIAKGLREFELSISKLNTTETIIRNHDASRKNKDTHWSVYNLPPIDQYSSAVACNGENYSVVCWNLN